MDDPAATPWDEGPGADLVAATRRIVQANNLLAPHSDMLHALACGPRAARTAQGDPYLTYLVDLATVACVFLRGVAGASQKYASDGGATGEPH